MRSKTCCRGQKIPTRSNRINSSAKSFSSVFGESLEIFGRHARGTNEAAECSSGEFLMIGNGERRDVAILHEDDMAATLAVDRPASLLENPNRLRSAQDGEPAHQIVTSTCCVSTVRGIPRSALTSRQAAIAWRTFSIASLRDWPCDTQPGMLGHSAIQMRSSSCVSVMRNFICVSLSHLESGGKKSLPAAGGVAHQAHEGLALPLREIREESNQVSEIGGHPKWSGIFLSHSCGLFPSTSDKTKLSRPARVRRHDMIGAVRGLVVGQDLEKVDLRPMIETTAGIRRGVAKGRWILETAHDGDAWEVVVEPDEHDQVIVVITAYRVTL